MQGRAKNSQFLTNYLTENYANFNLTTQVLFSVYLSQ